MATEIAGSIRRAEVVPADRATVWTLVEDLGNLATLIPGVTSISPDGPNWRWVLDPVDALGFTIEPHFTVRFDLEPGSALRFEDADTSPRHTAHGAVTLDEADGPGRTRVAFAISVGLRLDVPKLLARPGRAILDRRMTEMADGFFANLAAALV